MSRAESHQSRVDYLLQLLCDERLDQVEAVELAQSLAASAAARRRYVESVQLCVTLADWSQPVEAAATCGESLVGKPESNGHPAAIHIAQHTAIAGTNGSVRPAARKSSWPVERVSLRNWRPVLAVAVLLLLSTTFWAWNPFRGPGSPVLPVETVADNAAAAAAKKCSPGHKHKMRGTYVARVVELTPDARWDNELQPREFLMRLRAGEQLQLMSGLAHLEFYSGAHIILHGPSKFIPTGPAAGKLETGRLTGKVDDGNFLLTTPTAKVVDLGTEFGVTVGELSNTDVCVFDGEVRVQPGLAGLEDRNPQARGYHLTQGMSVRVAATGQVSEGQRAGVASDLFTRSFPLPPGTNAGELDLVDVICGGNGRGKRLAAAIDPLTGQWDRRPWHNALGAGTRHGDRVYHASTWHPFLDGTFVPNNLGEPLEINSLGRTIILPKNRGYYTWGPIWARRVVNNLAEIDASADSWGAKTFPVITERLSHCRLGGIGIHASVGITFDLQAISQQHRGLVQQLRAVLTNLDNSKEHNPEWAKENPRPSADFYVFVDGELRHQMLDFARNVEGVPFEVDLSPTDRFLTFVTTDGANSNRYDHIVIIDPVLIVHDADASKLSALGQRHRWQADGAGSAVVTHHWQTK
ncbi:MAG: NPCBM/NEW2 domain-containing protein [Pirellulales bacterium]